MSKSDILLTIDALSQVEINSAFDKNVQESLQKLEADIKSFSSLKTWQYVENCWKKTLLLANNSSIETFIRLSSECLLRLKQALAEEESEIGRLLSVGNQRAVRLLLDRVVSVGVWPNLLPGVGPPRTSDASFVTLQPLSDLEKYDCLCLVTSVLVDMYHNDTLHGIVLPQFLSPLLCSLCQLTMVPLKKSGENFLRLQRERFIFQQHLDEVINKIYQPMVLKELMVIQGNKKSFKWLKQGVGRLLTQQLHRPNGVLATLNAVRDAANFKAPSTSAYLESLVKVITASPALHHTCSQILELLDSKEADLIKVAVLCVKALHGRDPEACDTHLLRPITKPLVDTTSEDELTLCLQRLQKCFAVPASDLWCLSSRLLQPYIYILFQLYCKVYQSVSHVRQLVEDLVWRFLLNCSDTELENVFRCLLHKESISGMVVNHRLEFVFGDNGGVRLDKFEEEIPLQYEEIGDCLMILFEKKDTNGLLGNKLFVTLLEFSAFEEKEFTIDSVGRKLVQIKLLAVLSENTEVQKNICKNPEPVIKFLKIMIEQYLCNMNSDVEIMSLVLVLLNVILNNCLYLKSVNWKLFSQLEDSLSQLKIKATNIELRLLAEETYEIILTRGAVKPKGQAEKNQSQKSWKESYTLSHDVNDALREACDPLLPVRGHALIQLGKLLTTGDSQAKAKKDQILCIFQENLKEDDSFLYLAAIGGLASAAAEFPDNVILSLCEQFSRQTLKPDTRLKVGETLVQVLKQLGDITPVYKIELINAFLVGTRDDDFLVRASSLSNLGELCCVLGFRIGPIIAEVLMCVRCVVQSDPSVEVRRAAVMLVTLLLKGLHEDMITVLKDVLLDLYHSLKQIYTNDKDDVTRLHAQLAIEQLNAGTMMFLFPKPQFKKNIFVLDPPP